MSQTDTKYIKTKYQLILAGIDHSLKDRIIETFKIKISELGLKPDSIHIIDKNNFHEYKANAPATALYFGKEVAAFPDINIIEKLISNSAFIIPVVDNLNNFSKKVPKALEGINGFKLNSELEIEPLVSRILECLSLLRLTRRLFISYRRKESRKAAIQLYEYLDECGFDVFLDTHSIRPGEEVQDELWHRLVDTDVVVLLHTPGFLESEWTKEELAKASAMSIGVLQLIWPKHQPDASAALCFPFYLKENDFENNQYKGEEASLTDIAINNIANEVESLRARSLAARQDNIIKEFMSTAKNLNKFTNLHSDKFITLKRRDGKEVAIIPTVGIPHGFTYHQTEELVKRIKANKVPDAFLLYDHRNIREKWLTHLSWLDLYLPVKTIKITETESWLKNI